MTAAELQERLADIKYQRLPLPAGGDTAARHERLFEIGHEDLSLAKLAEAHWDAVAILQEAGREPADGALYAVWASEIPGQSLSLRETALGFAVSGVKQFCSGAGLVDRALITVGHPAQRLVDLDLRHNITRVQFDATGWQTDAFRLTQTSSVTFAEAVVEPHELVCEPGWYLERPGFWHGAIGPAACWAGGIAGLLDFALESKRRDPHTQAHVAAMHANVWAMKSFLLTAGNEIDRERLDVKAAEVRALTIRHLIEQAATDTLRRFARAFGPYPLAMNAATASRYSEADLYLRQSHGERDLESLAAGLREQADGRALL